MAATHTDHQDDLRSIGRHFRELRRVAAATQFDIQRESGIQFARIGMAERGQLRLKQNEYDALSKALKKLINERLSELLDSFTATVGA
jgi:hypothetical protein